VRSHLRERRLFLLFALEMESAPVPPPLDLFVQLMPARLLKSAQETAIAARCVTFATLQEGLDLLCSSSLQGEKRFC